MYWYPRNWGFKSAKIQDELDAMITAAKAKGLDEMAVDSIWLKGDQAKKDFDAHNGLLFPINEEGGLNRTQHKL